MAKQTERQKLAQQIAREKGIKYKSALRYLQRSTATGTKQKIKNPKFTGLSEKTAKKAKRIVKREKKKAEQPRQPEQPRQDRQQPKRRANFRYSGNKLFKLNGNFEHGSDDDIRDRTLRIEVSAKTANKMLNMDTPEQAADEFLKYTPYINRMLEFYSFEIDDQSFTEYDFEN